MNNISVKRKLSFQYNRFADLFYYLLAHMPINCAADVSDSAYTAEMALKLGISPAIPPEVTRYYEENYDRLMIISFFPLVVKSPQQLREALASSGRLTDKDMDGFAEPMIGICERLSEKFYEWWTEHHEAVVPQTEKAYERFRAYEDQFSGFFEYLQMERTVLFSYSLRKNGRAFSQPESLTVYLSFPEKPEDITDCFLQYLHECTHFITDPMINRAILMADGSHELSEYQVLCFDEYLIDALCPELSGHYRDWIGADHLEYSHKALGEEGEARLQECLKKMVTKRN